MGKLTTSNIQDRAPHRCFVCGSDRAFTGKGATWACREHRPDDWMARPAAAAPETPPDAGAPAPPRAVIGGRLL